MNFRTELEKQEYRGFINYESSILTIGSCFANEIGEKLYNRLFHILINPSGTLYNPSSIRLSVEDIVSCREYGLKDLIYDNSSQLYHSFNHHSTFSGTDYNIVLNEINKKIKETHLFIKNSNLTIFLTLGSARCFVNKASGSIVSNCHKFPSDLFIIKDLTIEEIEKELDSVVSMIRGVNKESKFVITVSPIRHKSYGLHSDRLSKSRLLIATDNFVSQTAGCYYFPAYEIMIDDLRDYRFYSSDMVHPSEVAVDYIYNIFTSTFIDRSSINDIKSCEGIVKRIKHKPILESGQYDVKHDSIVIGLMNTHSKIGKSLEKIIRDEQNRDLHN